MRSFTFNGVSCKDLFLVNAIRREYLPPIEVPTIKVPNRAGEVSLKRNEIGVRTIEVDFTLMGFNDEDLRARVRDLKSFLLYTEDKELIFSDEPNLKYFARFSQTGTSLEEIASMGQGTLIFICFDPFAYNIVEHSQLTNSTNSLEPTLFLNEGSAKVYPILRVATSSDATYIKITNLTNNKSITFNDTVPAWDVLLIDTNKNTVALQDPATNTEVNGLPFISLDSEFFPLEVGENQLVVANEDTTGVELAGQLRVYWRERYL